MNGGQENYPGEETPKFENVEVTPEIDKPEDMATLKPVDVAENVFLKIDATKKKYPKSVYSEVVYYNFPD